MVFFRFEKNDENRKKLKLTKEEAALCKAYYPEKDSENPVSIGIFNFFNKVIGGYG